VRTAECISSPDRSTRPRPTLPSRRRTRACQSRRKRSTPPFVASARGDRDAAWEVLRRLIEKGRCERCAVRFHHSFMLGLAHVADEGVSFSRCQAVNKFALGQGKLKEGTQVLEAALQASPSTLAMVEPFLFNPCSCFNSLFYLFALPEHRAPHSQPRSTNFGRPSRLTRNASC
jgi:hypothetical protein